MHEWLNVDYIILYVPYTHIPYIILIYPLPITHRYIPLSITHISLIYPSSIPSISSPLASQSAVLNFSISICRFWRCFNYFALQHGYAAPAGALLIRLVVDSCTAKFCMHKERRKAESAGVREHLQGYLVGCGCGDWATRCWQNSLRRRMSDISTLSTWHISYTHTHMHKPHTHIRTHTHCTHTWYTHLPVCTFAATFLACKPLCGLMWHFAHLCHHCYCPYARPSPPPTAPSCSCPSLHMLQYCCLFSIWRRRTLELQRISSLSHRWLLSRLLLLLL